MYQYPNSIYRIVSFQSEARHFDYDTAVDWACDMLTYGYETPNLLMLAAIKKTTERLECEEYLLAALDELHLPILQGQQAEIAAVWINIHEMSLGVAVWQNLTELHIYTDHDPENPFWNFNLLYWAKGELDYDGNQYYWHGDITCENAEQTVVNYSREWILKHKPLIDSLLTSL